MCNDQMGSISKRDDGMIWPLANKKLEINKSVNTTVATITTPTYSSGVAGLNGVKRKNSPTRQRCLVQTLNIGGNLKWLSRHIALVIGKVLETTKGHLFGDDGIVRSATNNKLQLTHRNHDCVCSHDYLRRKILRLHTAMCVANPSKRWTPEMATPC